MTKISDILTIIMIALCIMQIGLIAISGSVTLFTGIAGWLCCMMASLSSLMKGK